MNREIKRIGVIGASGGIGSEVMKQSKNYAGYEFVPIGRRYPDRKLDFDNATIDDYRAAIEGLDSIIHLAAMTSEQNDPKLHEKYNYEPTANIAKIAAEKGVPFIYAGSTAMYTRAPEGKITDETPPFSTAAYGSAKIRAHELAQKLNTEEAKGRGYKPIQVVPGATLGPDSAWTHLLVKYMKNPGTRTFTRFMLNSELGWTDIEDVANLLIQIATNPHAAKSDRYLAVNGMAKTNELMNTYSELAGLMHPKKALPRRIANFIGKNALRVMGKKAKIAPETLEFGLNGHKRQFYSEAARRDYNWRPKTLDQTLNEIKSGYKPKEKASKNEPIEIHRYS